MTQHRFGNAKQRDTDALVVVWAASAWGWTVRVCRNTTGGLALVLKRRTSKVPVCWSPTQRVLL